MPLSEHEQRMLDQIESALYAEDPKFVSSVTKQRVGRPGARRRLQGVLLLLVGLALLVGGLIVDVKIAGTYPIISLIGFLIMFAGGLLLLLGPRKGSHGPSDADGKGKSVGGASSGHGKFSDRMADRFNKRFDQGDV
ncbi:MAG: DUF3040 domain-containing protein [Gordonia sp. (in: high G+C Gram-positive bacteria)]